MWGGVGGGGIGASGWGVRVDVNREVNLGYGGCKPRIKGIDKCK